MKKRALSLALVLCMVLTLLPTAGFAAVDPTENEMEEIFVKSGMLSYFYGSNGGYFDDTENVQDSVAYYYAKDVLFGAEYDQYLDDDGEYWTLPYDVYIYLIDSMYVNHSDMKDYLSSNIVNGTTGQKSYDAEADTVTVEAYGGIGDVVAWEPLSIYHNDSVYYVQGLCLSGNEETGDVTDGMVENVDYYLYRSSYTDENGQIVNTESKMRIQTPVELELVETESGLKIAGYYKISNYIIDDVLYDTEGNKYYPVTVSYYEYDSNTKKYTQVSSNGTNPWVFDVGPLEWAYTIFDGINWRVSTDAVVFKVFVDDGWQLKNVTYKDNSGEGNVQVILDSYHIIPDGALTINVYSAKTSDVIETTIVSKNGASMTTSGDDTYYSTMTLVVDELESSDGSDASQLVISQLGGNAKAISYDIHMERNGSEFPVLEGDSVTVTLPVPEGWNADDILVFYVADDGTVTDMEATPGADGNTVTFTTTHFSAYVMAQKDQPYPFNDVNTEGSHKPYADAILWAAEKAITTGYADGSFRPDNSCTRAQVVTFLWRAAGSPEPESAENPFVDVSPDGALKPYYKAILWAVEQGITSGVTKTEFAPNRPCTRAQFVTFLWRYKGKPASSGSIGGFDDADSIASPYRSAVAWAVEEGVTTGYGNNTFRPNNACTRAQVVTFLYRDLK